MRRRRLAKASGSIQPTRHPLRLSVIRIGLFVTGLWCLTAAVPDSAWAVQAHRGAEGLVSHQIGHLLFTIGMAYLLVRICRSGLKHRGWFHFKMFLGLLIVWNLLTFVGHCLNEFVDKTKFIQTGDSTSFRIDTVQDAVYYLTRLDHLALVPAFAFLLLALRHWRQ